MQGMIPFSIYIHQKERKGYLQVRDFADPPKLYFVFIGNYIVGSLAFNDEWIFDQEGRYRTIGKQKDDELKYIANLLGEIVMLWYE